MRKRRLWQYTKLLLLAVIVTSSGAQVAFADTPTSTNYQLTESQFGAGSTLESCSAEYCTKASIGDMTQGGTATSGKSTAAFGSVTDGEPLLEVIVESGKSNLGVLSTKTTATKTTTIRIRNYLSDGYTLQLIGQPPKFDGHTLDTPKTPTASEPGTEQFAVNAAANTTPEVGSDPRQVPSGQTSFGLVNENYRTPNLFSYQSEDVVAHSLSESGRTDYTISMIINISNQTPAGHYDSDFSAVVIPVY